MSKQYINPFDEYVSSSDEEISPFVNPLVTYLQENTSLKEELRETKNELTETKARLAKLEEQMAIVMDRSRLCPVSYNGFNIHAQRAEQMNRFIDFDCQEIMMNCGRGVYIQIGDWGYSIANYADCCNIQEQEKQEKQNQRQITECYMFISSLHNIRSITLYTSRDEKKDVHADKSFCIACNIIKLLFDRNKNIDMITMMYPESYCDFKTVFKQIDHHKINTINCQMHKTKMYSKQTKQEIRDNISECNVELLGKVAFIEFTEFGSG